MKLSLQHTSISCFGSNIARSKCPCIGIVRLAWQIQARKYTSGSDDQRWVAIILENILIDQFSSSNGSPRSYMGKHSSWLRTEWECPYLLYPRRAHSACTVHCICVITSAKAVDLTGVRWRRSNLATRWSTTPRRRRYQTNSSWDTISVRSSILNKARYLRAKLCVTRVVTPIRTVLTAKTGVKKFGPSHSLLDYLTTLQTYTHTHTHIRTWWQSWQGSSTKESNPAGPERWAPSRLAHDNHPVCVAMQRPSDQETVADILGDMAEDFSRWEATPRDDLGVWCLPEGMWERRNSFLSLLILIQLCELEILFWVEMSRINVLAYIVDISWWICLNIRIFPSSLSLTFSPSTIPLSLPPRTYNTPMSSSVGPRWGSSANWRSRSSWNPSCRPSEPALSTAMPMYGGMQS